MLSFIYICFITVLGFNFSTQSDVCSQIYSPVCGNNNVTYPNKCYKPQGVDIVCFGRCPCGGPRRVKPYRCPYIFDPVCGTDGVTYPNDCEYRVERMLNPCIDIACFNICPCSQPQRKYRC